jgi:hypothetical protein
MSEKQVSLRQSGVWGAVAFGVALAVVIGVRLDRAALAVVVGVVCGAAASIPTSMLIVSLLRWRDARGEKRKARGKEQETVQSPSVVVVAPPAAPQLRQSALWSEEYALPLPTQRQFSVIGEEEIADIQ